MASEIKAFELAQERDADLAPYWEMAAAAGKRLPDVLRAYVAVESRLATDFDNEILRIAEMAGVDLEAWAERVLEANEAVAV